MGRERAGRGEVGADLRRFSGDLGRGHLAAVDANVLIYHLEGLDPYVHFTGEILGRLSEGSLRLLVSVLTVAEILAGPYRERDEEKANAVRGFLLGIPNALIADVTLPIADRAARTRAFGLRMPDALVVGTALVHRADCLLTNDPVFKRPIPGAPRVMLLDDYVVS